MPKKKNPKRGRPGDVTVRSFSPAAFASIFDNAKPGSKFIVSCSSNLTDSAELRQLHAIANNANRKSGNNRG